MVYFVQACCRRRLLMAHHGPGRARETLNPLRQVGVELAVVGGASSRTGQRNRSPNHSEGGSVGTRARDQTLSDDDSGALLAPKVLAPIRDDDDTAMDWDEGGALPPTKEGLTQCVVTGAVLLVVCCGTPLVMRPCNATRQIFEPVSPSSVAPREIAPTFDV